MSLQDESEISKDKLVDAFIEKRDQYQAFDRSISGVVKNLLKTFDIDHIPIESRTKTISSLRNKVSREGKIDKYNSLEDVTDLVGVRVILYNKSDIERVCEIIESTFEIDEANSINKTKSLEPDRFGYLSVHYVVSYDKQRNELPENKPFTQLKAEIQIRTVVQHAWAAIDRKLRYNQDSDVPLEVRRRLFRISALLELADDEFSGISGVLKQLQTLYVENVASGNLDIKVNKDSVAAFLEESDIVNDIISKAKSFGANVGKVTDSGIDSLLRLIELLNIDTIGDLHNKLVFDDESTGRIDAYFKGKGESEAPKLSKPAIIRNSLLLTLPAERRVMLIDELKSNGKH